MLQDFNIQHKYFERIEPNGQGKELQIHPKLYSVNLNILQSCFLLNNGKGDGGLSLNYNFNNYINYFHN